MVTRVCIDAEWDSSVLTTSAGCEALGLSQEKFAYKVGMDRTYVGGIERGERNPSLRNIWKLAEALNITPSDLLADAQRLNRKRKKK